MAEVSKSAEVSIELNGLSLFPPVNWQDVGVKASFIEGDVQPAITTEEFEFILDAYTELKNWISAGNIFQGVPFQMAVDSTATLTLPNTTVFDGYIDLRDAQINDTEGRIFANVRYKDDVSSVSARLQALDYGFLYDNGTFTDADFTDLDYVVVKIDYTIEAFIQSITLYLMAKQLSELAKIIAVNIGRVTDIGGAIKVAAEIAYAIALLNEIIKLGTDLINAFVQPKRTHKCISYRKMIEKVCNYLGYTFETSVSELDNYYYLPSNTNVDQYDNSKGFLQKVRGITNGLPNILDYGYRCTEFFELLKQMFNGRFAVFNGTIQFHSELNPYWEKQSTYVYPDVLEASYEYNTDELNSNVFVGFATDIVDGYTIQNFTGTNYQVITSQKSTSDLKGVIIENLAEIRLPVALASRKDSLNGFEKFLRFVAGLVDTVANTITSLFPVSGTSNLAGQILDKVGVMKVETNNHRVPKVVYLNSSGKLPANHRDLLSAKYLWSNYINELSFIQNNYKRQRKVFEGVEVPFGWTDFQKLINNSYFVTIDGRRGKITDIEWIIARDKATVSYWIEERYTQNLKEEFIEPS